jgi:uncharacterized iron-regulated membrane protein
MSIKRQKQARTIRLFRKIHRLTGAALFVLFLIISITGLLLTWKKHSGGLILPKSHKGSSSELSNWLPVDSLHQIACQALSDSVSPLLSSELDRIDIRKEKGIVKFVFVDDFWEIQLDGATGNVLLIEQRRSDIIEKIHDGSILDYYFGTSSEQIKLIYSSLSGLALLAFTITGFWLWYGPKKMRRKSLPK